MKPEQFIRWFGIEDAKYLIEQNINCNDFEFSLEDLKRLVESLDRVEHRGGLSKTKDHLDYLISFGSEFAGVSKQEIGELQQAIRDHETIYGGSHES